MEEIENLKTRSREKGAIAPVLTLVALGVITLGILAGRQLVGIGTRFLPKAISLKNKLLSIILVFALLEVAHLATGSVKVWGYCCWLDKFCQGGMGSGVCDWEQCGCGYSSPPSATDCAWCSSGYPSWPKCKTNADCVVATKGCNELCNSGSECHTGFCYQSWRCRNNACEFDNDCVCDPTPTPYHKVCEGPPYYHCERVAGKGTDQCTFNSDCKPEGPIPTPTSGAPPSTPTPPPCRGCNAFCTYDSQCCSGDCRAGLCFCPVTPTSAPTTPAPTLTPVPSPTIPYTDLTPTPTPTITSAPIPSPTASPQAAKLKFKIKLPDVAASVTTIPAVKVKVELSDGKNTLTQNSELVKEGDYYKTSEISINITQATTYAAFIKQEAALRRAFKNVTLTPGKTLDCTLEATSDCGELATVPDTKKPLLSGDSDGFNTSSDSYNKIDIADFQRYVAERTGAVTTTTADFNLDGKVDTSDLGILARNFGLVGD